MNQKSPIMSMESFEALVAPHLQPLHGFACRRTRDPIDAEDLVQDALLRAWDRIDSLGDPERIRSWLFTILVNLHIEQLRKRTRRQRLLPIVDLDAPLAERAPSPYPSPLDEVVRRSAAEAVHDALAKIPELYAMAVELRDLEGLSYKEIAQILDVPEGQCYAQVHIHVLYLCGEYERTEALAARRCAALKAVMPRVGTLVYRWFAAQARFSLGDARGRGARDPVRAVRAQQPPRHSRGPAHREGAPVPR
jgi:RNA polymerase sigma-70 factor (ECF subfamily)